MNEQEKFKIGKVTLDPSLYSGTDSYSEGAVEDELLKFVQEHTEAEYNREIAKSGKWSMLYHLSHIRGNLVDFLPITENQKVLEVGSGCGAVTGTLAAKAGKVTCIELSLKRSMINAWRHMDCSNIEILVGNFQDIEKTLTDRYDYIMLVGVLEYAGSYINDPSPYEKFLGLLSGHLAQGGQIAVAIENKYGMKYFAGCGEDHTGILYDGIEGYPSTDGVRTFSREGLMKLAGSQKLECEFYYPFPDYKLPVTVYSDKRLPRIGELAGTSRNFDRERFNAFDEGMALDETVREGRFPFFSNSFLALLSREERIESFSVRHPLYSKHSNERSLDFCIRTDLEEDGNGRKVIVKYPLSDGAVEHLERMARSYEKQCMLFEGTKIKPNACKRINDGEGRLKRLEFEYLTGPTLDDELATCVSEKRTDDGILVIRSFCDTLRALASDHDFEMTDGFSGIFGNVMLPQGMKTMLITNLDLIFTNFIMNGGWNVIDYEWTFDFPVPVDFVIYRAIFYYTRDLAPGSYDGIDLFGIAGITDEERITFAEMEHRFQLYIAGDRISLDGMYSIMGRDSLKLERAMKAAELMPRPGHLKLYFDRGKGFNEEDTMYLDAAVDDECHISFDVQVPDGCQAVRIDPADHRCMIKLLLAENGFSELSADVNGYVMGDNTVIYDTDDPQILLGKVMPGMRIHVEYIMQTVNELMFSDIAADLHEEKASSAFGFKFLQKGIYTRVKL